MDAGIAALLFDLSGHGESDADPNGGEEAFVEDLDAVFQWASTQPDIDRKRIGVAGSSLGGVVALDATRRRLVHPAALVLRAPPAEHRHFVGIVPPSLVVVGSHDPLYQRVRDAVSIGNNCFLAVVTGASHLFEEPGALEEATRCTVDWFVRNLMDRALEPAYETGEVD
jgi:putative phosphoribosyl transferase